MKSEPIKFFPGFYRTRSGAVAEVLAIRGEKVIGWYDDDVEYWDMLGRYHPESGECWQDLIGRLSLENAE